MQASELLLRNETFWGTSPAVQWLRLPASSAGSVGLIPGRELKSHMLHGKAEYACNAGDAGDWSSIPGLRRSPGGGNDNPLQYPCMENPMDRGARQASVHGVTKSRTWLRQPSKAKKKNGIFSLFSMLSILVRWECNQRQNQRHPLLRSCSLYKEAWASASMEHTSLHFNNFIEIQSQLAQRLKNRPAM